MNERCPAKTEWYFPDGYLPDSSDKVSHESLCVLNIGATDAKLELVLYYEDREPIRGFFALCPSKRSLHIRMDKLKGKDGIKVAECTPYSIYFVSDVPVMCQYTRVDATKPSYTLMTTMGL